MAARNSARVLIQLSRVGHSSVSIGASSKYRNHRKSITAKMPVGIRLESRQDTFAGAAHTRRGLAQANNSRRERPEARRASLLVKQTF
jgi:hypothetical protein